VHTHVCLPVLVEFNESELTSLRQFSHHLGRGHSNFGTHTSMVLEYPLFVPIKFIFNAVVLKCRNSYTTMNLENLGHLPSSPNFGRYLIFTKQAVIFSHGNFSFL
jgi:hypothetical protein